MQIQRYRRALCSCIYVWALINAAVNLNDYFVGVTVMITAEQTNFFKPQTDHNLLDISSHALARVY